MISILFYILSMFLAVMGYNVLESATGIFQEIAALLIFLLAVMFLIGCFYY